MGWKPLNLLSSAVILFAGIAFVVLITTTGWQVYGRYVLNDTPTWAERLALLLILFVALPVAAVGLRENFHLGISLLVEMLPRRMQRVMEAVNALILLFFGGAMAWFSWQLAAGTWNRAIPLLGVPQGLQYVPLVICGILIAIFMAERLLLLLRPRQDAPMAEPDVAADSAED